MKNAFPSGTAPLFHATFRQSSKRQRRANHAQPRRFARSRSLLKDDCSSASSVAYTDSLSTIDSFTPKSLGNIEPSTEATSPEPRSSPTTRSADATFAVTDLYDPEPSKRPSPTHSLSQLISQREGTTMDGAIISGLSRNLQQNMSSAHRFSIDPKAMRGVGRMAAPNLTAIEQRQLERISRLRRKQQEGMPTLIPARSSPWQQHDESLTLRFVFSRLLLQAHKYAERYRNEPVFYLYPMDGFDHRIAIELNKIRMLDKSKLPQQYQQRAACATIKCIAESKLSAGQGPTPNSAASTSSSDDDAISIASTLRSDSVFYTGPERISNTVSSSMTSIDAVDDNPDAKVSEDPKNRPINDATSATISLTKLPSTTSRPSERDAAARFQTQNREDSNPARKKRPLSSETGLPASQPMPPKRARIDEKADCERNHHPAARTSEKDPSTTVQQASKLRSTNPGTALAPEPKSKISGVVTNLQGSQNSEALKQYAHSSVSAQRTEHSQGITGPSLPGAPNKVSDSGIDGTKNQHEVPISREKEVKPESIAEVKKPGQSLGKPEASKDNPTRNAPEQETTHPEKVKKGPGRPRKGRPKNNTITKFKRDAKRSQKIQLDHQFGPFIEDSDDAIMHASDTVSDQGGSEDLRTDKIRLQSKPTADDEANDDSLFVAADSVTRPSPRLPRNPMASMLRPPSPSASAAKEKELRHQVAKPRAQGPGSPVDSIRRLQSTDPPKRLGGDLSKSAPASVLSKSTAELESTAVPKSSALPEAQSRPGHARHHSSNQRRQASPVASANITPPKLRGASSGTHAGTGTGMRNMKNIEKGPALEQKPRPVDVRKPAPISKTSRPAQKPRSSLSHTDVLAGAKSFGPQEGEKSHISKSNSSQAGKQINDEAIRAYYESLREGQQLFDAESSQVVTLPAPNQCRAPSPVSEEDELHYSYSIMRRQWVDESDETQAEWIEVSESPYYNLDEANRAAQLEATQLRNRLGLDASCDWTSELDEDDMRRVIVSGIKGTIHVKVTRRLRTRGCGEQPTAKIGWLSKKIYTISLITSRVNQESQRDRDVEGSSAEGGEDGEDELVDVQAMQTYPHGAYTILDQANQLAVQWLLDTVFGASARIDDVQSRFAHRRQFEEYCVSLAAERRTADLYLETETDGAVVRHRVCVEEVRLNGPWNI